MTFHMNRKHTIVNDKMITARYVKSILHEYTYNLMMITSNIWLYPTGLDITIYYCNDYVFWTLKSLYIFGLQTYTKSNVVANG